MSDNQEIITPIYTITVDAKGNVTFPNGGTVAVATATGAIIFAVSWPAGATQCNLTISKTATFGYGTVSADADCDRDRDVAAGGGTIVVGS